MSFSTTTYPYDTVVYITDVIGDEEFQASGVLISPDEVLTASLAAEAHVVALERAPALGFREFIISAPTTFQQEVARR